MLDQIITSTNALRTARSRHGHALRLSRRAGADLVRAAFTIARPMLAAEAVPLLQYRHEDAWVDSGRGVLLIDNSVYDHTQVGHDETYYQDGPQLWARADGSLVTVFQIDRHDRTGWERRELRAAPVPLGYREAVRRYGAETVVEALKVWLTKTAELHEARAVGRAEQARTLDKARVALTGVVS